MGNLFDISIAGKIYALHESKPQRKSKRLGGSLVGEDCERKIWYSFRHANQEKFEGRMLRLFETGHLQEDRIIKELEDIGFTITDAQKVYTACKGHFVDKPDGVVNGKRSLEVKTMNDKTFKQMLKNGMPDKHKIQINMHMILGGFGKGLYIAINKNDETIHVEKVDIDKRLANATLEKASRIIESLSPPMRIGRKDFWQCKFCTFSGICHDGESMDINCRTCKHSFAVNDGIWHCYKYDNAIGDTDIGSECPGYEAINNDT